MNDTMKQADYSEPQTQANEQGNASMGQQGQNNTMGFNPEAMMNASQQAQNGYQHNAGNGQPHPSYHCTPDPMTAQPAMGYAAQPAIPQGGYPPAGYAPQQPVGQQPSNNMGYPHPGYLPPMHPQAHSGYYAYPQQPGAPYPQPHATQHHQSPEGGLASFFDFRDERFVKGAVTGAALTFLLTNESLQKNTLKSVIKFWNMLQGGVEEMKERIQDLDAEIKSEEQQKK